MRAAIDVRTVTPMRSGIGNYVLNLMRGLRRVAPEDEFLMIGRGPNLALLAEAARPGQTIPTRVSHESHPLGDLWEHCWLPRVLDRAGVQVMHGPAVLLPLGRDGFARVATIHDLVAFLYPETIPRKYALYMRWLLRRVVKRAERLVSVSQSTKDDLVRVLGVDPAKVTVAPLAASPTFRPATDPAALDAVRRRYGIRKPFFYHVGNVEPRKNLVRLVKAYLELRPRLAGRAQLVISGQKGWLTGPLFKELAGLNLADDVIFTGFVPQADLPLLMSAARAFVFPSLYEGFGLPALEAMSCGAPLVTSNISSLPEIAGQAALLVEPTEVGEIAAAMWRLFSDDDLHARLSREGLARAAQFSWDACARQTLAAYRAALKERQAR
ncbi:MAG: glycosyltransferase family 4 protein [Thermodesulfobacteriota bacterium]